MKKVIVYLNKDKYEMDIDEHIFIDYKLEACTQLIEKLFSTADYQISPFMFCEDFGKIKSNTTYNTYKIIINAGYHQYAEKLRIIFQKENQIDLADEPIKSSE